MDVQAAVLSALSIRAALQVISVTLHLFAFLFPKQAIVKDGFTYDFIIAGAGSAGCVLARRLSDNPNFNVLLIEDGDDPTLAVMLPGLLSYNQYTEFDWNYTSENDHYGYQCYKDHVFHTARGHGLGGSSSINYFFYVRGCPNDYNSWAEITNDPSWSWDSVLPYFKRSERLEDRIILNSPDSIFHGTDGELGINTQRYPEYLKYFTAFNDMGYETVLDTNGNKTLGFNFPMLTLAQGLRQSTGFSFLSPIRDRKNLHVLKRTKVTKVIIDNNVATGVEVVTENNEKKVLRANLEVILSAGAINSPQILMLSGIGPKEHLESLNITTIADLPVGHNLQDHYSVFIAHQTDQSNATTEPQNPFEYPLKFLNGFVSLNESQNFPDSQIMIIVSPQGSKGLLDLFAANFRFQDDISQIIYDANKDRDVALAYVVDVNPKSRGRVYLSSKDYADPPKIFLETLTNQMDIDNIVRFIENYIRIENSTYFKSVNAERIDLAGKRCAVFPTGSKDYWRCYALCLMNSVYHYSGTCSMSTVVDSQLRVKGVDKLRVVDASVFPVIPSGNINAPVIMVAEKAADMIKNKHCKSYKKN